MNLPASGKRSIATAKKKTPSTKGFFTLPSTQSEETSRMPPAKMAARMAPIWNAPVFWAHSCSALAPPSPKVEFQSEKVMSGIAARTTKIPAVTPAAISKPLRTFSRRLESQESTPSTALSHSAERAQRAMAHQNMIMLGARKLRMPGTEMWRPFPRSKPYRRR